MRVAKKYRYIPIREGSDKYNQGYRYIDLGVSTTKGKIRYLKHKPKSR